MGATRKGNHRYFGIKAHFHSAVARGAKDFTNAKGYRYRKLTDVDRAKNRTTSRVRAKIEHQFGITKWQFSFPKVRYRGLEKNAQRLFVPVR